MKLLFINELGPNYKNENIYEFIFGKETEELWGDEWDARPAHGKPGPPELQYIESVGVLNNTKVSLDLVQNSDYFNMEHALDNVIALGWETYEDDYDNGEEERLVFHFGEKLKEMIASVTKADVAELHQETAIHELGFTSVLLVDFASKIEQAMGITVAPSAFFTYNTVAKIADYLSNKVPLPEIKTLSILTEEKAENEAYAIIGLAVGGAGAEAFKKSKKDG